MGLPIGHRAQTVGRRYLIDDIPFAVRMLTWAAQERPKGSLPAA